MKKIFGALAVLVFLVGCGCQQNNKEEENVSQPLEGAVMYDCQGEDVQVVFDNSVSPATADLSFVNRDQVIVTLPSVESASGAKYSDGSVVFWTENSEAMLTMEGDDASLQCVIKEEIIDMATIDENGNEVTPGCKEWFDGCNNCQVGELGMPMACTRKFCDSAAMEPARCMDDEVTDDQKQVCAEAGGVWSEEYNSCFEDPDTMAGPGEK